MTGLRETRNGWPVKSFFTLVYWSLLKSKRLKDTSLKIGRCKLICLKIIRINLPFRRECLALCLVASLKELVLMKFPLPQPISGETPPEHSTWRFLRLPRKARLPMPRKSGPPPQGYRQMFWTWGEWTATYLLSGADMQTFPFRLKQILHRLQIQAFPQPC